MRQYYDIADELEPRKRYIVKYYINTYSNGYSAGWHRIPFTAAECREIIKRVYKYMPSGTVDVPEQTTMVRCFESVMNDTRTLLEEALELSKTAAVIEGKGACYNKMNSLLNDLNAAPEKIYETFQNKALFPAAEYCRTKQISENNRAKKSAEIRRSSMLNNKDLYSDVYFNYGISIEEEIID